MAAYPSGNPGVYPLDPDTRVGQFRLLFGDVESTPYVPAEPGIQNYGELSDSEIEVFLVQGGDSLNRAVGFYYLSLAGAAAKASRSVKDYDLQIDTTKRAADLREIAKWWFDLADGDDAISGEEAFEIVPTGTRGGEFIPELAPPIWGRQYTLGVWRR